MKRLLKISLIFLLALTGFIFTGCKGDFSVYLFTSQGGSIAVNNSQDKILTKDILFYDNSTDIKLEAFANIGFEFKHWLIDNDVFSTDLTINISVNKETVIKAIFVKKSAETPIENPDNPDNPDKPTPSDPTKEIPQGYFYIGFTESYFNDRQSANIILPDNTNSITINRLEYYNPQNEVFRFKIVNNFTNEYKDNSKMLVKNTDGKFIKLLKDYDGFYYVDYINENTKQFTITQTTTEQFSINYGSINGFDYEFSIKENVALEYDIVSDLCFEEYENDIETLLSRLATRVVVYANKNLINELNFKVSTIQIVDGNNTLTLNVTYTTETIDIIVQSGEITNTLFDNTIDLYWEEV